jgi:DNA replication protein DnaC
VLNQQTISKLRAMRLGAMADGFEAQMQQPDLSSMSFEDRLGLLVDHEWSFRQDRKLKRLLTEAKLRLQACMEDIDYSQPRGLDKSLLRSLAGCDWIVDRLNCIIEGPTGAGKTYLACALANAACRMGFSVRYYRMPRLLTEISMAHADGTYPRLLARLARYQLLILDDWGISPLSAAESREVLEIVDDRSQGVSTLLASQLPPDHWHTVIGDPSAADAILDRLVHNAHLIRLRGESMRKVKSNLKQNVTE